MANEKFEDTIFALDKLLDFSKYVLKDTNDIEEREAFAGDVEMFTALLRSFRSGDVTNQDIEDTADILKAEVEMLAPMVADAHKDNDFEQLEFSSFDLHVNTTAFNELLKAQKNRAS